MLYSLETFRQRIVRVFLKFLVQDSSEIFITDKTHLRVVKKSNTLTSLFITFSKESHHSLKTLDWWSAAQIDRVSSEYQH